MKNDSFFITTPLPTPLELLGLRGSKQWQAKALRQFGKYFVSIKSASKEMPDLCNASFKLETGIPPLIRTLPLGAFLIFKLYRANVANGGMTSMWIVEPFYVVEHISA